MSADPSSWISRISGWCFTVLAATFALYCTVKLIACIWPTLAMIVGIAALIVVIIRIVVYYTSQKF
jgi:hypothetical protein